ncbi:MAG: PAS domain-containing protein [Candidatus Methylumidiphilus sp.]|nr:PAS domain-containing protein [Pseudomonadota bacterium]
MSAKDMSPNRFELLYGMLLDAIPSSVLLVDEKLHIVSVNRNFLVKSQRGEAMTVGRPLAEVFPTIIMENTDIERRIREVFRTGTPVKGQRMTYRAPGVPIRIYYYSILPIPTNQVMLLMEDVTEQVRLSEEVRRVERHLASVVESASDIVLSTDTEGRILTWNSAAEKLSGLSTQEVRGQYFFQFCGSNQQQTLRKVFLLMKSGNESHTTEFPLVTSSGDSILVSWVFSPMKDDYGQTVGAVVVGRDLAERRKLENQLRQSQKLAALGVMAGGIAHEIRNPLAVCYSAAEFLLMDNISSEFRNECSRKIQAGIQKASAIIENLLRFARPSPDTEMVQVDLNTVIKDTLDLITNQARVQQIRIQLELEQRRPVLVLGVSGLLQQVFMNIFLNGINAMPDGGVLSITEEIFEAEVAVRISDTGMGIEESDLDKIFDPFHTTSPIGKGTGLGLSICYSIAQQHLGSIHVQSSPGKGATLTVRLPLL